MRQRTRQARQESGEAVLDAIEALIAEGGLVAVNAREVARRAGIAVGSVYLVHGTLDRAVSLANGRTLARLDAAMEEAIRTPLDGGEGPPTAHASSSPPSAPSSTPTSLSSSTPPSVNAAIETATAPAISSAEGMARCLALGRCYARFARTHREAWTAITAFSPSDKTLLSMHHGALDGLVARIVDALRLVRPDLDDAVLSVRARTFFAAVHGVVHTALEGWFMGTPADRLDAEIDVLVRGLVHGLATGA